MTRNEVKWLEPFSAPVREAVGAQLAEPGKKLACFDADGTLWNEDIGEAFFRWLAAGGLLPAVDSNRDWRSVYEEYEERVRKSRSEGYSWAVQCMAGLEEQQVRRWASQMAAAWPNYRPAMAGLIGGLAESGWDVWLVSASNSWIVQAGAPMVGAAPANVLGIRVEISQGRLTNEIVRPVTCNRGKVEAIEKTLGRLPDLAVGDSLGDLEMLESAKLPLVVGRADKANSDLCTLGAQRGWATHLF